MIPAPESRADRRRRRGDRGRARHGDRRRPSPARGLAARLAGRHRLADRLRRDERHRRHRSRRPLLHHRLPLHDAGRRDRAGIVPDRRRDADIVKEVAATLSGRVGIDPAKTSIETHGKLLEAAGEGVEIRAVDGLLTDLRRVKDPAEVEAIAAAAALADEVYGWIEERGLAGKTEREVALGAEAADGELGAEEPSFPTIVAAGVNGASPHAVPGEHVIAAGEYVTVDMGAIVDGYCSDCTRTLVEGDPDPAQRQVYELVLKRAARRARRDPRRSARAGGRRRLPGADRRGRLRRAVRARARPRGWHRGPRAAATLEALRRHAARRRRRHRRARHLRARRVRDQDRGPRRGHRRRLPDPQQPAQVADRRRLRRASPGPGRSR